MTPIESLMEELRKCLVSPEISIFFNDTIQSYPRGWPDDDHSMDQLLTSREDSLTIQGHSEPGEYQQELDGLIHQLIYQVGITIAALKTPKAKKLIDGIAAQIEIWVADKNRGVDSSIISCFSESAEVDSILASGMADPLDLVITSKEKLDTFQRCRRDALSELHQSLRKIQMKVDPNFKSTQPLPTEEIILVNYESTIASAETNGQEYFTTQQLCVKLQVTERCVANWRANGKIAFTKIGRKIIYSTNQVDELINKHYKKRRPW